MRPWSAPLPAVRASWRPGAMTWRCSGMRTPLLRPRSPNTAMTHRSVIGNDSRVWACYQAATGITVLGKQRINMVVLTTLIKSKRTMIEAAKLHPSLDWDTSL